MTIEFRHRSYSWTWYKCIQIPRINDIIQDPTGSRYNVKKVIWISPSNIQIDLVE